MTGFWPVESEFRWIVVQINILDVKRLIHWHLELFSCLAYSLFATSRHNSVGTFAVVALMTGNFGISSTLSPFNDLWLTLKWPEYDLFVILGAMVDEYIPKEYLSLPSRVFIQYKLAFAAKSRLQTHWVQN